MNKLVKGAIAGAVGIALLLGGAGTFALWNSSIGVASGTIATGTLAFGTATGATWTDNSPGALTTTFDPTSQKIVPGDVVALSQNITISATGKNLVAQLAYLPSSVAIPADLVGKITPTITVTKVSGDATITGNGSVATPYTITPAVGGSTILKVVISYAFDRTTSGIVGQGESVDLSGASFTLTQIHS
ncbi:MAG TPA: alternate-type signal peptide domain-containing protein [Galbitalea sp.]